LTGQTPIGGKGSKKDMTEQSHILLFDGVCNLCNKLVIFIIRRDKKAIIKFTELQSHHGRSLLEERGLTAEGINSIVFIERDKYFLKSSAVLHLSKALGGGWSIIFGLIIIPKFIRDFFYDLIAKYRYRIFGISEKCLIPGAEIKDRFL
jgi:predicted DCC family thiol-disulfide oxidoreductase YuxK